MINCLYFYNNDHDHNNTKEFIFEELYQIDYFNERMNITKINNQQKKLPDINKSNDISQKFRKEAVKSATNFLLNYFSQEDLIQNDLLD